MRVLSSLIQQVFTYMCFQHMKAILNSLMDRGPWDCKNFQMHCASTREKSSKLFALYEFNTRCLEKIRPNIIKTKTYFTRYEKRIACPLVFSHHDTNYINFNSTMFFFHAEKRWPWGLFGTLLKLDLPGGRVIEINVCLILKVQRLTF